MFNHDLYMQRCLHLAVLGQPWVAPNPMVGAIIVYNDKIIGEGFHQKFGGAHAEVNAINSVSDKSLLKKSTIYVSLEPCTHYGKTPPCTNLIIENKIPRVVVACLDPNPLVAGKGINLLKNAGIEVEVGVLEHEAKYLNKRFNCYFEKKRPFITLKWAASSDNFCGIINTSKKITNWFSDVKVHQLRSTEQAILIGFNTAKIDNPKLNTRNWFGKNPIKIVIDLQGELSSELHIFNGGSQTLVFSETPNNNSEFINYILIDKHNELLHQIMSNLYERNIQSVLIEGGPKTQQLFIDSNLWDEAHIFTSSDKLGEGIIAPIISNYDEFFNQKLLNDSYSIFTPKNQI
ncbi:MAG TPA: bifunctional diaminohydroxyphosphoribosylaminopyrimidine deaminase/5-amino-6-(5-phosphoribosylamino)uracil reductase RibD [Bacteroidia bacterium]|nr:bifunctional diaminohydroxyphosphoribosylaminopyrimidine deaminase/5-amino-6-(5-phosphoribosylamino)uracil reductase RibD [Bacteroidia bacterium]